MTALSLKLSYVLNIIIILAILMVILIFSIYFTHPQESSLFNIKQSIPTISLAGAVPPEGIIFTLFIHLISILALPLYISIYYSYKEKISSSSNINNMKYVNIMHNTNNIALALGVIAVIAMYLVGSVSVNYDFIAHFALAIFLFIPASIHIILYRVIMINFMTTKLMVELPPRQVTLIVTAFHITVTFNIIVIIIDIIIYYTCFSNICRSYVVDILPVLEFTTVIAFLIYFESFRAVYDDVSITMTFHNNSSNNNNDVVNDNTSSPSITHTLMY